MKRWILFLFVSVFLFWGSGSGCDVGDIAYPSVNMVEQLEEQGINRQAEMVRTLSDQHQEMMPEKAEQLQPLMTKLDEYMAAQLAANRDIAAERLQTVDPLGGFDWLSALLGALGLGGVGWGTNLTRKVNQAATK